MHHQLKSQWTEMVAAQVLDDISHQAEPQHMEDVQAVRDLSQVEERLLQFALGQLQAG